MSRPGRPQRRPEQPYVPEGDVTIWIELCAAAARLGAALALYENAIEAYSRSVKARKAERNANSASTA